MGVESSAWWKAACRAASGTRRRLRTRAGVHARAGTREAAAWGVEWRGGSCDGLEGVAAAPPLPPLLRQIRHGGASGSAVRRRRAPVGSLWHREGPRTGRARASVGKHMVGALLAVARAPHAGGGGQGGDIPAALAPAPPLPSFPLPHIPSLGLPPP